MEIRQEDGQYIFSCNGIEFEVFADNMVKSVQQLDTLSDTAWQNILLGAKLPTEPWIKETAKAVVMGIVQNVWYQTFTGAIPEKVARRQEDREREYPKMIAVIAERRAEAVAKAERTKAAKAGVDPAVRAAEREAKVKAKVEDKAKRAAERAADKVMRDADKAAAKAAGTRMPRATRVGVSRSTKKYELVSDQRPKWGSFTGQKQVVVKAFVELGVPSLNTELAALCTFEGSRQTSLSVVNYYLGVWTKEGLITGTDFEPVELPVAEVTAPETPAEPTKKQKKQKGGK